MARETTAWERLTNEVRRVLEHTDRRWCISYEVNTESEDEWVEDFFYTDDLEEAARWVNREDDESVRNVMVEVTHG